MKTLSELKRCKVGDELKLVYSFFMPHKFLNIPRKIEKMQTNALMFEGGSWLYFPKASDFEGTEKGFLLYEDVMLPGGDPRNRARVKFLEYEKKDN